MILQIKSERNLTDLSTPAEHLDISGLDYCSKILLEIEENLDQTKNLEILLALFTSRG